MRVFLPVFVCAFAQNTHSLPLLEDTGTLADLARTPDLISTHFLTFLSRQTETWHQRSNLSRIPSSALARGTQVWAGRHTAIRVIRAVDGVL
jgi:hypothetical protein